jgi:putative ubiquitin-RnfH superfamily antitoxin RatB of RatAB toxin-antitoxin module
MAPAESLGVEVVYCPAPGAADCVRLSLPVGTTAAQALQASGMLGRHGLAGMEVRVGVWSRLCDPDTVLRDRDRVEVYRPLTVDPKEARRQRYQRQVIGTRKR